MPPKGFQPPMSITMTENPFADIVLPPMSMTHPGAVEVLPVIKSPAVGKIDTPGGKKDGPKIATLGKMATTVITAPAETNTDFHIVKTEMWDADVMETMLTRGSEMGFSAKDLRALSAYRKAHCSPGQNQVVYHYGKSAEKDQLGRLYARGGLQSYWRCIRNPLLAKHYWEIDFENAHFWLCRQIARQWKMDATNITLYCDNRSQWLAETDPDPAKAKLAFIKVAYGGSVAEFHDWWKDDFAVKNTTHLVAIEEEMKALREMCWAKHPKLQKHSAVKSKRDPMASLFALVLQTAERQCLLEMDAYLKTQGRSVDVYIHDCGAVRKADGEREFPPSLLRAAEAHIKAKTGYDIKLVSKGFKHNFISPEKPKVYYDEEFASREFVRLMGDKIAREGSDIYFFNDDNGMWLKGDTAFRCAVAKHKQQLIWKTITDEGKEKIHNYGGSEKNVMAMYPWIATNLPDTKFMTRNGDSAYGKLLFEDGIYDFITDTFKEGFDPKIVFSANIDRPFPRVRDEGLIASVRQMLFVNAFDEDDGRDAGDYLRKALCMGLVGDYTRKKFYFALGEADCGKGATTTAFSSSFCGFVGSFNPNELKYNAKNGQDESRKLAWLKEVAMCRLLISNEFRIEKGKDQVPMDGNLVKGISSGGDEHKGRANYENASVFVNRATVFIMANDAPSITPNDSGVKTRLRYVRYKLRFVADPKASDERLADPDIKGKFNKASYKDSLFFVMCDTFKELADAERKRGGDITAPACVIEETKEWLGGGDESEFAEAIRTRYEITGLETDVVPSGEIVKFIKDDQKMALSDNKIGRLITKLIKAKNPSIARDRNPTEDEVGKQRLGIKHR